PITILEAFASGLPAVSTDVGGVRELVTPEVGLVVEQQDPTALKEALDIILKDTVLRNRMAQAALLKSQNYGYITIPY
ncbi:MAG TPA: glycosyltransferase, partial [Methanobacterium sp.]|nr:glycosyltransferase [Methanobacterium sp.]